MSDNDGFWKKHQNGHGNVVVAQVYDSAGDIHSLAVFGNIRNAQKWVDTVLGDALPDQYNCIFIPMIVDIPQYGHDRSMN